MPACYLHAGASRRLRERPHEGPLLVGQGEEERQARRAFLEPDHHPRVRLAREPRGRRDLLAYVGLERGLSDFEQRQIEVARLPANALEECARRGIGHADDDAPRIGGTRLGRREQHDEQAQREPSRPGRWDAVAREHLLQKYPNRSRLTQKAPGGEVPGTTQETLPGTKNEKIVAAADPVARAPLSVLRSIPEVVAMNRALAGSVRAVGVFWLAASAGCSAGADSTAGDGNDGAASGDDAGGVAMGNDASSSVGPSVDAGLPRADGASGSPPSQADSGASSSDATAGGGDSDAGAIVAPPGWTLLWSDEFNGADGTDVDPTKWIHDVGEGSNTTEGVWNPGNGWGNDELEYYTAGNANTQQQGGNLVISALKNTDPSLVCYFADKPNSANTTYHTGTCEYTSGRLKTVLGPPAGKGGTIQTNLFSHVYGRFEMRAQIPPGVGMWPAFWMMGTNLFSANWPACGELDVMEEVGEAPGAVHGTSHSTASGDDGVTYQTTLPNDAGLSDAFHVYAIEWGPTSIKWFLDDTVYGTETAPSGATTKNWPFADETNPFFLILNLAISSGDANSWGAAPTPETPFPAEMKVDYVRVYEASNEDP